MKYTIQDLRDGKVTIKNDGTVEELNKVLRKAFPGKVDSAGKNVFYFSNSNGGWSSTNNIPPMNIQSVKDFLEEKWEPKWGEEVEVSIDGQAWHKKSFLGLNKFSTKYPYVTVDAYGNIFSDEYCRKISTKTELTLEEIATRFGIPLEQLRIKDKL